MNDPRETDSAVREKAAALLTRRDAGWTAEDAAEFALWRAADPRHEAAVRQIEAAQRLLGRLSEVPGADALRAEADALATRGGRVISFAPWMQAAAGLAAAACLGFVAWSVGVRLAAPPPDSYHAATGEHRTVALADGSTLLLNGGSRVEVSFAPGERRVNLEQGEVHFAVAKDSARPFIVAAGTVKVRAVGTAFNVKREPSAIEVVVTEGKVMVSRDRASPDGTTVVDALFLTAGESVAFDPAVAEPLQVATPLNPESLRAKLAWQAPRLEFSNTSLADAIAQFNRHSRVQLELADASLGPRPIGGTFNADNAEAFVNLLVASGDIRAERVSDTRIVLRSSH